MNKFLAIMCFALLATASAAPAYNYQQQRPTVSQNFRPSAPIPAPAPQYTQQQFAAPVQLYAPPAPQYNGPAPQYNGPAPQYLAPVQQPAVYAPVPAAPSSNYNYQPQQQTIVNKDIYIHSAPEETEEIGSEQSGGEATPIRKNYRIVFIKAPSQNLKLNLQSIQRAQASNEEKTVIYVLSKKPDIANLQSQLSAAPTEQKANKPEVYFIKYKTQEEANRAQQEIQAQYDALGGSTHISDEGIAPVTSVIGGGPVNVGSVAPGFGSGSANGPSFASGSNFVQSASNNQPQFAQATGNNQQQFVQQSFQGSQGSANAVSFGVEAPNTKYLPAKKK